LVAGERHAHRDLERALSAWLGFEDVVVFSSGYAANVGLLSAVVRPGDLVVSDALNHASIIDGLRLSRSRVEITPHGDVAAIERALRARSKPNAFVVVEAYYSMDADSPDLRRLRTIADACGAALIVDEAHALGVLGPDGRGSCALSGIAPDALVGTLGKALGAQGGFVAGSHDLTAWLWNRARSFVFSTGLSPLVATAARENVDIARAANGARAHVASLALHLRTGLGALGLDVRGHGHVVPWWIGNAREAVTTAATLRRGGFDVQAIRPPTVPDGSSRLRLSITAAHTIEDVDALLQAVAGL
jgi:8-amino-7-oxononanoate synthase